MHLMSQCLVFLFWQLPLIVCVSYMLRIVNSQPSRSFPQGFFRISKSCAPKSRPAVYGDVCLQVHNYGIQIEMLGMVTHGRIPTAPSALSKLSLPVPQCVHCQMSGKHLAWGRRGFPGVLSTCICHYQRWRPSHCWNPPQSPAGTSDAICTWQAIYRSKAHCVKSTDFSSKANKMCKT